jgi:hypothetical protein
MQLSVVELHQIQHAAKMEGADCALEEVCHQLPALLDSAVKSALEVRKAKPTKPYTNARRSAHKPVRPN